MSFKFHYIQVCACQEPGLQLHPGAEQLLRGPLGLRQPHDGGSQHGLRHNHQQPHR